MDPLVLGSSKLNDFQVKVLDECIKKGSGGLSLPMGSGKTLLSLIIGLTQTDVSKKPFLVVVAKNLVENWKFEINKFFGDSLIYDILHTDYHKNLDLWELKDNCRVIITTTDVISKYYKKHDIENKFVAVDIVNLGHFNQHRILRYNHPSEPFLSKKPLGVGMLYSIKWECFLVDEIQKYTKVSSFRCKGLAAICANNRWGLSGTIFDEPSVERILGYHLIINDPSFPRTLPAAELCLRHRHFKGIKKSLVFRNKNEEFISPKVNEYIITHDLIEEEQKIYMSMKNTMKIINAEAKRLSTIRDTENARRFSSYLLAIITYLRQSVVCPILPIANVALDMSDYEEKSELSNILLKEVNILKIGDWFNNEKSVLSSRMKNVLEVINKHQDERLVIFTCFRSCLDIFKKQLPTDRANMTLSSTMTTKSRAKILETFGETKNGILLLTYELGAEGLNLQIAHTILLMDLWWNSGKTQQAIARVLRFGQQSTCVNIYYFTSNTGIEKAVFNKHEDKLIILDEIQEGPLKSSVKEMKVNEIIAIVEKEDNALQLNNINNRVGSSSRNAN